MNNRLTIFLDNNNILEENQAVFRKEYSCTDHIFTLHALFEILRKGKKKLFAAFIDFSQAFDKVWRAGLWHKLLQKHVNGNFLDVILNMYDNIKSCVKHNGSFSAPFISEIGVRQGENLSPILFSLYLNDLQLNMCASGALGVELNDTLNPTLWLKLLILLYADDTVILSDNETDCQSPKQFLTIIAKTGICSLPIEPGQYDGTPFDDRKCLLCDSDQVGSEKHYLFDCYYFWNIRQQYLTNHLNRHKMSIETFFYDNINLKTQKAESICEKGNAKVCTVDLFCDLSLPAFRNFHIFT